MSGIELRSFVCGKKGDSGAEGEVLHLLPRAHREATSRRFPGSSGIRPREPPDVPMRQVGHIDSLDMMKQIVPATKKNSHDCSTSRRATNLYKL